MTTNDRAALEAALVRYGWFQECLLKDIRWDRFGTTIHLDFDYIWDGGGPEAGRIRDEPRRITLSLLGVQELKIHNALTAAILAHPERLDWGISEISRVRLEPAPDTGNAAESKGGPHNLVVEWESERRIDAIFTEMRVAEGADSSS